MGGETGAAGREGGAVVRLPYDLLLARQLGQAIAIALILGALCLGGWMGWFKPEPCPEGYVRASSSGMVAGRWSTWTECVPDRSREALP